MVPARLKFGTPAADFESAELRLGLGVSESESESAIVGTGSFRGVLVPLAVGNPGSASLRATERSSQSSPAAYSTSSPF